MIPIYLVHWNAPEWCRAATDTILRSDIPVQITVVDNSGGLDLDERVRVIDSGGNLGYAGGANLGLREWLAGDQPYCVIGSHDLHVEPETIRLLVQAADGDDGLGIVAPVVEPSAFGEVLASSDGVEVRTWSSGTCLLMTRRCIDDIGLFDERFGSYTEDRDLGLRATDAGWKVGRVLAAQAHGLGSIAQDEIIRAFSNQLLLAYKRGGARGLFQRYVVMAKRLMVQLARIVRPTKSRRLDHVRRSGDIIRAVGRSMRHLPRFVRAAR